jgi:hypothetical protein
MLLTAARRSVSFSLAAAKVMKPSTVRSARAANAVFDAASNEESAG